MRPSILSPVRTAPLSWPAVMQWAGPFFWRWRWLGSGIYPRPDIARLDLAQVELYLARDAAAVLAVRGLAPASASVALRSRHSET